MTDNLIFYINKLSQIIVAQSLENDKNENLQKQSIRSLSNCLKKVRQKGCDVLLNLEGEDLEDPCITDYGGNWSPFTLLTDYGRELQAQGSQGGRCNDVLLNALSTLDKKKYDCVEELLKFLLLLKRPLEKGHPGSFQNELESSDFLLSGIESRSFVNDEFCNEVLSKTNSFKKALQYEESWTRHFDSKFQLLGEHSRRNLNSPENLSLKSILSSKPIVDSSSRTNVHSFMEFLSARNYKSEKSLFDINSSVYLTESPLLDSFVDRPIVHKLPALRLMDRYSCRSGFLDKSTIRLKSKSKEGLCENEILNETSSGIELKRNSNCSHSFAILYDKPLKSQGSFIFGESIENLKPKGSSLSRVSTSKEIILCLWEQERALIKQFQPELGATLPTLRMISICEYVEDVKYLFTGINSNTFQFDTEKDCFTMVYGTCLDDVTPESLYHFSKDFMEIGNCYVKLISCVHKIGQNNFDTCTTISQAFWKSVFDYLELHYSLVLQIPATTNLMALKSSTADLHEIITTIANICRVHTKKGLPQGGELLTYLLQIAEGVNKECVNNIVFGILKNCCSVYFMYILHNWMFRGQLDIQNSEFFVDFRLSKGKTKSRSYYNSFILVDQKIPSFLRGYEESFYNCGKSVHFLKLFNAEDAFCQILEKGCYPSMQLCFSDEGLEKLESEFKEYEERVLKTCGARVTIKTIREEEKEKERQYLEEVRRQKALQEEKRKEEQFKQLEELKTKKEKQNKLLNEQRSLIDAEKERRKQEEREEELRLEAVIKKSNEARENLLNQEKTRLTQYFGEMMESLNRQIVVSQSRHDALQKMIEEKVSDVINCNEIQTDHEGNIVEEKHSDTSMLEELVKETEPEVELQPAKTKDSVNSYLSHCLSYDENLNPRVESETETPEPNGNVGKGEVRKSTSSIYQTTAAEEAARNKCRVLKSEFGLGVDPQPAKPGRRGVETMTDLERNRQKVVEYNILLKQLDSHISLTSIAKHMELPRPNPVKKPEAEEEVSTYAAVGLERKTECIDLGNPPEKSNLPSRSSESNLTSLNDFSVEIVSNASEELERTHGSSSILLNEKMLDALTRDAEIFYRKTSPQDIFCSLKEVEIDNLPCTDYLKFQRYLRKSALIPLRTQEKLANDALLKHLIRGENLISHLRALRGYFFLNDGEFGRSFTHQVFRSLSRCTEPNQFFERSNLNHIVNEALNYTMHGNEANAQNLSFRIVKMPPFLNHSSHDVLSPFELSYKVDWPLNFILTEKAVSQYRMVFKFLLKLKRINWTMNENFLYLNAHFKNDRLSLAGSTQYHRIQIFRHAMTQVMVTLDDYIFSNGIQLPWMYFLKDLETTANIDQLYQKHVCYVKDVLSRCFLSSDSEDLLDYIHTLIELALKFHYTSKSSAMEVVNGKYQHPKFEVLKETFGEFCFVIKTFLRTLKEKLQSNEVNRAHQVLIEKFDLKLT